MTVPTRMRAVVTTGHGGLDMLDYRDDVPVPVPAAGEVLIKVGACSINNTDINTRTGWYASAVRGGTEVDAALAEAAPWDRTTLAFPRIQGADIAGSIVAVGGGVLASRVGERVLVDPWIVDPADLPSTIAGTPADNLTSHPICEAPFKGPAAEDLCSQVLRYGMKRDFNLWLASLGEGAPARTLGELRAWNQAHKNEGAIRYGQGRLDFADAVDLARDKARYERDRRDDLRLTREQGLDAVLTAHKLDALLFPGSSGANYATKAGYPIVVVPFGMTANYADGAKGAPDKVRPFGVSFVGGHCEDPKLVGLAYAFEQATHARVPPPGLK